MRNLVTFIFGIEFGTGISMSGMANPAKVVNFFDIRGLGTPALLL